MKAKKTHPELLVGLDSKLARVRTHWAAVDEVLPVAHRLVLLLDVDRAGFGALAEALPGLRNGARRAEQELKLARAAYERHKGGVHGWLRSINVWMRGGYRGTDWMALVRRVPGRGQSYGHWWRAAVDALGLWRRIVANPPAPLPGGWEWPLTLGNGRTVEQFGEAVEAFEGAWRALVAVEVALKVARGALERAQGEATALLMAYGHGVRARLGQKGALVRSIPAVWPKHKAKRRAA